MVLQELVQHVEEVVLHQGLDHQLVQVVLEDGERGRAARKSHSHTIISIISMSNEEPYSTCTVIWNWFRERMYSISTAMMNLWDTPCTKHTQLMSSLL